MIKFKAIIKFNRESLRKKEIISGYRPGFSFNNDPYFQTTGQITLLDQKILYSGESALAEIIPVTKEYLGKDFGVGTKFIFFRPLYIKGAISCIIQCL